MKVLVTGACGYKGTVLVPKLLAAGHEVVALDIMWFGNFLQPHPKLTVIKADVRAVRVGVLEQLGAPQQLHRHRPVWTGSRWRQLSPR